jgi:hypothetical protein
MDYLRDPLWQFVGAVLAVITIIVSIVLYFFQRRKKTLAYEIISRTAVLSASEEIAGKLQILFQGEAVREVHLLVLRLINNGNVPVTSADYEREISFVFIDCIKILSAEISDTNPSNLSAEIALKDNNIRVEPILLNPGDSITIKTLISGFKNNIEIDGRIVGVKTIGRRTEANSWSFKFMVAGLIVFSIGFTLLATSTQPLTINENPLNFTVIVIGYLIMFVGLTTNRTGRNIFLDRLKKFLR